MLLKVGVAMMAFALAFAAVVVAGVAFLDAPPQLATAVKSTSQPAAEPLTRSDPGVNPWVERNIPAPEPQRVTQPEPEPQSEVQPGSRPEPAEEQAIGLQPDSESEPEARHEPRASPAPSGPESKPKLASEPVPETQPEPDRQPKPEPTPEPAPLPAGESAWSEPTDEEIEAAGEPRRYELPAGAIMGLTVPGIEIYNAPVFDSTSQWALTNGVAHETETSLPWSPTPQRNVYLVGHRMGYSGTWSRMLFYHLDKLSEGDKVLLKDRDGGTYEYRVFETFVVDPTDVWVMGQVEGRDMLTLQTCTPIPTFDKRLIVRAERV